LGAVVDHVQPIVDQPARGLLVPRERALERFLAWACGHAVLFPIVALFVIGVAGNLPQELLQDTWLAVLGGREIVHHGLPSQDTLTIWAQGRDWVDQQWLAQLAFYGLYALGGIKLTLAAHAVATAGAFTLAIVLARRRGASTRSICWVAVPAYFILTWGAWNARAQSFALPLFVLLVALLARDARRPSRLVFLAFPLLVLWANLHGTAVIGAALVALWGVTYAVERRKRRPREWAPRAAALMLAPFVCVMASPYAASLPGYYHTMLLNSGFRQLVVEWLPTSPSAQTAPFYALAFATVWLLGRAKGRLLPFEQLLLLFTLLVGLQSMRSVIWFTLAALVLFPTLLDAVVKPSTAAMRFPVLNRAFVLTSIVGAIAVVAVIAAKPSSWFERNYPPAVLAAVDRAQERDPGMRVFAHEAYGDWLLLRRPELGGRMAFDIRFELLHKRELRNLQHIRLRADGWRKRLAPYSLFVLKKGPDTKVAKALLAEPGARLEYRGHDAIVVAVAREKPTR
jgi:hypothetical protein